MPPRKTAKGRAQTLPADGRTRAVIEGIAPHVDHGRFAVKRIVGDRVEVEADCFADGHDTLACVLRVRREAESRWDESPTTAWNRAGDLRSAWGSRGPGASAPSGNALPIDAVHRHGATCAIAPSVGSRGDSYDNAMAESIIGLFKTEVIHLKDPWRHLEAVDFLLHWLASTNWR